MHGVVVPPLTVVTGEVGPVPVVAVEGVVGVVTPPPVVVGPV